MGKARLPFNPSEILKMSQLQTQQNYGLQRMNYNGTTQDRGSPLGTVPANSDTAFKLDARGGFMLGALGLKGLTSDELAVTGILDLDEYNIPRLSVTNAASTTLIVMINIMGDGQEQWIRANGTDSFTIQNTSGTGDETTGNIELMQGADYTMTGDDWMCFHYDVADSKWHQVTAGKNDIGGSGGSGEVFTWTANHSANNFSLTNIDDLDFTITTANDAHINANQVSGLMQFVVDDITFGFQNWIDSNIITTLDANNFTFTSVTSSFSFTINSSGGTPEYTFQNGFVDFNSNVLRNTSGISINSTTGIDFNAGTGNTIYQDSLGNQQYRLAASNDEHSFWAGTELFRIDGGSSIITSFVPMNMSANPIYMTGGLLVLDTSFSDSIDANTPGSMVFNTAGATRMQLAATGLLMSSDLSFISGVSEIHMNGANIEMGAGDINTSGDVDFATGGTVDFFDVSASPSISAGGADAIPATPTSYWKVKFNGNTRWIPYYST